MEVGGGGVAPEADRPRAMPWLTVLYFQQQKRKLRLYISNTFNPAKPDAEDSDGSIASWELRVEGKLLDDVCPGPGLQASRVGMGSGTHMLHWGSGSQTFRTRRPAANHQAHGSQLLTPLPYPSCPSCSAAPVLPTWSPFFSHSPANRSGSSRPSSRVWSLSWTKTFTARTTIWSR